MNDRIKLAEAMGWKLRNIAKDDRFPMLKWIRSDGQVVTTFDPFTDANDCNALIKHLNGLGYDIVIGINASGRHDVDLHYDATWVSHKQGDNWMHGVCELALKVIS